MPRGHTRRLVEEKQEHIEDLNQHGLNLTCSGLLLFMMMMMMLSLLLPECTCSAAVKPIAGEHVTSFAFIQSRLPSHANILGYNVKTEIVELHFEDDAAVQAFIYDACRHGNQRIDTTSACRGQSSTKIRCLLSFT